MKRNVSTICVCGREKRDVARRYCEECLAEHRERMREAHLGKGVGRRKKRLARGGVEVG